MKNLILLIVGVVFWGCTNQSPQDTRVITSQEPEKSGVEIITAEKDFGSFTMIPVSNHFNDLVSFIEKNGTVVPSRGVPCDYQYTFFDSHGHRHALVTIRRNENSQPDLNGKVLQISVWAYYNGQKDQNNFFGYIIHRDFISAMSNQPQDLEAIESAYYDFVKRAI